MFLYGIWWEASLWVALFETLMACGLLFIYFLKKVVYHFIFQLHESHFQWFWVLSYIDVVLSGPDIERFLFYCNNYTS